MYGRSGSLGTFDLSFFIGATLIQICLGAYDLGLNFDGPPIRVMMQTDFGTKAPGEETRRHDLTTGHLLRSFLNHDVSQALWGENGTLILTFDVGDQILIFDNSDEFESYTIHHAGKTIVV